jgi:hypothetical protein
LGGAPLGKAREAGFGPIERATKALDEAMKPAANEIAVLKTRVNGPPQTKDVIVEQRQRELRERLMCGAMLPCNIGDEEIAFF